MVCGVIQRVYDEDDTMNKEKEEKAAPKTKTREERDAEMLPKVICWFSRLDTCLC